MDQKLTLPLTTDLKNNEFFEEDAISKSTIHANNNSFDKLNLDDDGQLEKPFTPSETNSLFEEEQPLPPEIEREACPNCQRSFFKGRLAPHLRSCTAERPLGKGKPKVQTRLVNCQFCQRKVQTSNYKFIKDIVHTHHCPKRPQVQLKALDKYSKYVGACINEEEEADETHVFHTKELYNSQPSFLPKIAQKQTNVLSRSVPIVKCPSCKKTFEQRAADKHIPICQQRTKINSEEKSRSKMRDGHQFCTNCGNKFANVHKYCGGCGKKRQ